ncbi:LamG-like jellyroll fold domain-containing protein, partial [Planctomycetota bacterium]
ISPANGAEEISQAPRLIWLPTSSDTKHDVYVGTDASVVEAADASTADIYLGRQDEPSLVVIGLSTKTTYYWRIDQVQGNQITKGYVWSFTTSEAIVVDDFENYTDEMPNELWRTWVDGVGPSGDGSDGNGTGAEVGNWPPSIAEMDIVHNGRQSMPMTYNNTESPHLSEAHRDFGNPQDWTQASGQTLTTLKLWYRAHTPPGEFSYDPDTETYTIGGSGEGIEGMSDSFRFVYKQMTGDGTLTVRLTKITRFSDDTHSGIMFRETLDPESAMVMHTLRAAGQVFVRSRLSTGQAVQDGPQVPPFPATLVIPHWMRLKREGDVFTAEHSSDGELWEAVGDPVTVPMAQTVYVGMAVAAVQPIDSMLVNMSEFKHVSIDGTVDQPEPLEKVLDIGMPANSDEEMYAVIEDNAGNSAVVVNPEGMMATRAASWTAWQIVLSEVAAQGVDLANVQKLKIGFGSKLTPSAGGTGKIFIDDIRLYPSPLVRHWKLDEDTTSATMAVDSVSGMGGAINGAISAEGKIGNAFYFDGNSEVEIVNFSTEDLKHMTITFWMNPDAGFTTTGGYKRIFSAGDNWEAILQPNSGLLGNNFYQGGGTYPQSTVAPPEGEWTHVAMTSVLGTADSPGAMEIYINGVFDIAADNADDDWAGGTVLIGWRPGVSADQHYKGLLDDIRIYSAVLSQAEIGLTMNER